MNKTILLTSAFFTLIAVGCDVQDYESAVSNEQRQGLSDEEYEAMLDQAYAAADTDEAFDPAGVGDFGAQDVDPQAGKWFPSKRDPYPGGCDAFCSKVADKAEENCLAEFNSGGDGSPAECLSLKFKTYLACMETCD